ncbi:MAG: hypothetical protein DMG62_24220, partial [Acidobacteria bacterium]
FTDALPSYTGLEQEYIHNVIDHAECYAKGHVHTNGLENFWSLLKRGIRGTYVSVEPFHLFRYLDKQIFPIYRAQRQRCWAIRESRCRSDRKSSALCQADRQEWRGWSSPKNNIVVHADVAAESSRI